MRTDPDVVRKYARVSRSYKESHGYHAEFEEEKPSVLVLLLYIVVVFGGFAVLLFTSL